jgi:uncharacterized protein HemY
MGENDENNEVGRFNVSSKFWRVFLMIAAVFLIFAGPTYISYVLFNILNVNYFASIASGLVLFIVGLLLMLFLIRKKIIT